MADDSTPLSKLPRISARSFTVTRMVAHQRIPILMQMRNGELFTYTRTPYANSAYRDYIIIGWNPLTGHRLNRPGCFGVMFADSHGKKVWEHGYLVPDALPDEEVRFHKSLLTRSEE